MSLLHRASELDSHPLEPESAIDNTRENTNNGTALKSIDQNRLHFTMNTTSEEQSSNQSSCPPIALPVCPIAFSGGSTLLQRCCKMADSPTRSR